MFGRSDLSASADVSTFDPRSPREFWLDGESVMCACPDCQAPVSIRLWLLVADCWQCGCSIELTQDQERKIQALLREQQDRTDPASSPHGVGRNPSAAASSDRPFDEFKQTDDSESSNADRAAALARSPSVPIIGGGGPTGARPVPLPSPRAHADSALTSQSHPTLPRHVTRWQWGSWLNQIPAWLISMLFHMALLALLALLMLEQDAAEDPYITLSTEANRLMRSGGDLTRHDPNDTFHFDLPVPERPESAGQRTALARADQDARELRVDPASLRPQLPSAEQIKQKLKTANLTERTFSARDPRVRVEVVSKEGGTTLTEASVARGLRWMSKHQNSDGSWSLHRFARTSECEGRCRNHGTIRSDSAATSLCLLPFLGAGQTHQRGIYKNVVAKGLRWLLEHQAAGGDLRAGSTGNSGMYAHGQGAIVLCEAYALTRDEQLREPAQRSIDFIVRAQHAGGGWRYAPGDEGDTSVLGWQLMALQSARAAELNVPQESLDLAGIYLDSVQYDDGSRYAYQPHRRPTHVMTAEALLCRMYLGWTKDFAGLDQGVRYLTREHLPRPDEANFYYWYYATQVLHHYGGRQWHRWNLAMRDILVRSQEKRGHAAGSWDPVGGHAPQAGRLYCTALAVCTLEVYYRHAPIFRQLELD